MNRAKGRHRVSRGVRGSVIVCLAGLVLSLLPPLVAQAKIVYVDINAGPTNDGTSWATAYVDLQAALTAAGSGDSAQRPASLVLGAFHSIEYRRKTNYFKS